MRVWREGDAGGCAFACRGAVVNGAAKCVGRVAKVVAGKVVGKMGGGKLPTFTQSEMVTKTVSKNQQRV